MCCHLLRFCPCFLQIKRFPLLSDVCHRTRQVTKVLVALPNLKLMCLSQMYSFIAEQRAGEGNQVQLTRGSDVDMDRYSRIGQFFIFFAVTVNLLQRK